MKLLLDTHSFLWFIEGNAKLSQKARSFIEDNRNEKFGSMASLLEIAIKMSLGKLTLDYPFEKIVPQQIYGNDFRLLPLTAAHPIQLSLLPFHHRDPFDRMIVAQSLIEHIPVLGKDEVFDAYRVLRLW